MTKHFTALNESDLSLVCGGTVDVSQCTTCAHEEAPMQDLDAKSEASYTPGGTGGNDDLVHEQLAH